MSVYFASQRSLHVALVPAGNEPWAAARGLPPAAGQRAAAEAVRRTLDVAPGLGIGTLTLHALSCNGWRRLDAEVHALLDGLGDFLAAETATCLRRGVRVSVIGRRNRLPSNLLAVIERSEAMTAGGRGLHLRLAIDYSARDALVAALGSPRFGRTLERPTGARGSDVDLLVRTGGEQRLGDFLLWECAHAELVFLAKPWPEFAADDLADAVVEFHRRKRTLSSLSPCRNG